MSESEPANGTVKVSKTASSIGLCLAHINELYIVGSTDFRSSTETGIRSKCLSMGGASLADMLYPSIKAFPNTRPVNRKNSRVSSAVPELASMM